MKHRQLLSPNASVFGTWLRLLLVILLSLSASVSFSQNKRSKVNPSSQAQTQTIKEILVQGNRKIETDAILAKLKSKVGEAYSTEKVREDIQSLFKTGFFYDIVARRQISDGAVQLTYQLIEKPSVVEVNFEGNSEIKTDELSESADIKAFEILNMSKIRDAVEKLQKMYEDKGFFLARIDVKIEEVKKDESVRVNFSINENEKVKVKQITFLGNKKLKDGFLKSRMITNESGFFTFLSGSGSYKQEAFERDAQLLKIIYFNEGYVQVKIDRPQVYVTPDKKSIYITFKIEEGEQYDVGEIDFAGDLLFSKEELANSIEINKRKVFSYEVLQRDLSELTAKYGDLGYAFANVIPRTRMRDDERKVDITFEFDKGNKVYFGQINVLGNSKTRDKVLRRELKIREGELYHETRKRESIENIQRLGFFEEVNFKTSTNPEKPDILNVDIVVRERNTGSVQLGAGYGSVTGFTLSGQVSQSNFLGKGQNLAAGLSYSDQETTFNLNFTEPYFLDTEWRVGFDAYQSNSNRSDYYERKAGGAVRFGRPVAENVIASLRYKLEGISLNPLYESLYDGTYPKYQITDQELFPLEKNSGLSSSVTAIIEYDKRNDRFSPSRGSYASASLEYVGVGGDFRYTKGGSNFKYFKKLFWDLVWRNNLSYQFVQPHNSNEEPPFNELYLLGGPQSLRGYRFLRVGRTLFSNKLYDRFRGIDPVNPDPSVYRNFGADEAFRYATRPYGGKQMLLYQMEFEFPLIAEAQIKGVAFYDVGQAEDSLNTENFYSDVGFGIRWFSPIGPLRFEWGFPLRRTDTSPDSVVFDFSVGSPF